MAHVPVRQGCPAGDAQGQGVGGTWFASAPDGKKAVRNADGPSRAEPAGPAGLSVRTDPKLGDIVVDKSGMTSTGSRRMSHGR